jgi:hypothetical protein
MTSTDYDIDAPGEAPHGDELIGSDARNAGGERTVVYPAPGTASETAQALLDAADELGLDAGVVEHYDGNFHVPSDVAEHADLPDGESDDDSDTAVADMTVPQLTAEIARRNQGRDEDEQIKPDGRTKAALRKALEDDDAS